MRRGLKPPTDLMQSRYNCHRHLCLLDISRKASLEQARCLFHNDYWRGLLIRCDRTQLQTHPLE